MGYLNEFNNINILKIWCTQREIISDISWLCKKSYRGYTVMFDLSKYFSPLYLEIYRGKKDFFLLETLKIVLECKKIRKQNSLKYFPRFFVKQNQTQSFLKRNEVFKSIFFFFLGGNTVTWLTFIEILKIRWISRNILPFLPHEDIKPWSGCLGLSFF